MTKSMPPRHDDVRFPDGVRDALLADHRRVIVVGARGWIGRTLLALLDDAFDDRQLADRLVVYGSGPASLALPSGRVIEQHALDDLATLPARPSMLFHLAFLTKDKVAHMDEATYVAANKALSGKVLAALEDAGVDRAFVASSGAAAFADDAGAAHDLRLYGQLKRDDEDAFAAWASARADERRAIITRIYAVSGPFINKHDTYALADFILKALAGETIEVRAPMAVYRGYVAVRDLLNLVVAMMLADQGEAVQRFSTGGAPMELGEVAQVVARVIPADVSRRPISGDQPNRYVGDDALWRNLLSQHGLVPLDLDQQIIETANHLDGERRGGMMAV